jgi:hypothetical protein
MFANTEGRNGGAIFAFVFYFGVVKFKEQDLRSKNV